MRLARRAAARPKRSPKGRTMLGPTNSSAGALAEMGIEARMVTPDDEEFGLPDGGNQRALGEVQNAPHDAAFHQYLRHRQNQDRKDDRADHVVYPGLNEAVEPPFAAGTLKMSAGRMVPINMPTNAAATLP